MAVGIREEGSVIVFGNGAVELGFDVARKGALVSLRDGASGCELICDGAAPKTLFRLALRTAEGGTTWLESAEAYACTWCVRYDEDGGTLTLKIDGFPGRALAVIVKVRLTRDNPLSAWQMAVSGLAACETVETLLCPIVGGVLTVGGGVPGEVLALPIQAEGYLFTDPYPMVDNLPLRAGFPGQPHVGLGSVHQNYPGGQSMQFMLYYHDQAGLYLATHDADMHVKSFHVGPLDEGETFPRLWIGHHPSEVPGSDAEFAYDTMIGVFHGDWYDGADIYKAWARQQWWCAQRLAERDIAGWVREGFGVWQMSNYHIPEIKLNHALDAIAEEVNGLSREIGVPLAALIFNYESGGAWTGPIGLTPKEGEEAFARAMGKLRAAGNRGFVYIPGGNWYVAIDSYDPPFDSWAEYEAHGREITLMNAVGERPVNSWYAGWHSAWLCPATRGNREILAKELLDLQELGCDWIQIDNFPCGAPMPCFNASHGHPRGHGPWYTQAWRDTLADVRARIKTRNPEAVLSVEGITEVYIPYLDLYDHRAGNMEYFGHFSETHPMGGQTIPLFNYVYGGYLGAYLAAYPETNRPEVLYWTRSLGKALAQGVVPTGGRYWPTPAASNPVTLGFYKKVIRATRDAWPYLMFGEMIRPPHIDVPEIDASTLKFTGECLDHLLEKNRLTVRDAAVQHGAWRAADGRIGYVFANISQQPVTFDVMLTGPATARVEQVVDGERSVLHVKTALPLTHTLAMAPLSVTMIEISEV